MLSKHIRCNSQVFRGPNLRLHTWLTAVVQHRMKAEYGVDTILEPLAGYNTARWAEGGWDSIDEATVRYTWYASSVKGGYGPCFR